MEILTYRAFTTPDRDPRSGNPAGVVLGADALGDDEMLRIAARLGFSETAFLSSLTSGSGSATAGAEGTAGPVPAGTDAARVRYFTPRAEIAFCGHATIASGVALARRGAAPVITLTTNAGRVPVEVTPTSATLVAVDTAVGHLAPSLLDELLAALRLTPADLDPSLPAAFLQGGNPHPVVFVRDGVLSKLDHDSDAVLALQDREGWDGTVPVVHREAHDRFVSRNPFPRGGIREDPATGSAAASLGAYLRATGRIATPARITVRQGAETGRPSLLVVDVPVEGRVRVTGTAEPVAKG